MSPLADASAWPPGLEDMIQRTVAERVDAAIDARLGPLQAAIDELGKRLAAHDAAADRVSILVFNGDLDRLLAGFIVATSAAAMGLQVSMYFTFWGLVALKKRTIYAGKSLPEQLLAAMSPSGPAGAGTSRLNMFGAGSVMLRAMMKARGVESLPGLITIARELGVRLVACQMAMEVMGITPAELIDDLEFGGGASYIAEAGAARVTLTI